MVSPELRTYCEEVSLLSAIDFFAEGYNVSSREFIAEKPGPSGPAQLDRGGNRVFPLSAASRPDQTGEPVAPPSMTGPVALLRSQNPRNEIAPLS